MKRHTSTRSTRVPPAPRRSKLVRTTIGLPEHLFDIAHEMSCKLDPSGRANLSRLVATMIVERQKKAA